MPNGLCPNIQCPDRTYRPPGSKCPSCGTLIREYSFWDGINQTGAKRRAQRQSNRAHPIPTPTKTPQDQTPTQTNTVSAPVKTPQKPSSLEKKLQNIQNNLGLLEGEIVKLTFWASRQTQAPPSMLYNFFMGASQEPRLESRNGMLVFTSDNMIWMQEELVGVEFDPALRIPLAEISGVVAGGTLVPHIRIIVGTSGTTMHEFQLRGLDQHKVRNEIEALLKSVREERRKTAQAAMASGTIPEMIFCKYCGAKNRSDQKVCTNCNASLD